MEIIESSDNFGGWDYSIYCVIMDRRFVVTPSPGPRSFQKRYLQASTGILLHKAKATHRLYLP